MKKITLIFTLIVLFLSGCDSNRKIFEEYYKMADMSWNRFDIVKFDIPVEEGGFEADFFLTIRHIPEIPYESLKYNFTFIMPSGEIRTADHVLQFADDEGNSLSQCMGDLCDLTVPVRMGLRVSEAGTLRIEIENKYTRLEMPGIMEVGLIVRESKGEL